MKFKRILSMLLTAIMLSTAVIAAFPTLSFAANSAPTVENISAANMYASTENGFSDILSFKSQIEYGSASEMLQAELDAEQLVNISSGDGQYSIYVNVYTGFVYYKNNLTGQVLMSNSYNYANTSNPTGPLMSQVEIEYSEITSSTEKKNLNSYEHAAVYNQIYVSKIQNGIRVNYTLGDTTLRYLVPGALPAERYLNNILFPIIEDWLAGVVSALKSKSVYTSKSDFTNYLNYYSYQSSNSPYFEADDLFIFAATVMNAEYISSVDRAKTQFVAGGYRDEFNKRFKTFEELFDLHANVYYCKEHSFRAATPATMCPGCQDLVDPYTTYELLFYDDAGNINTGAINQYIRLINETVSNFTNSFEYESDITYFTAVEMLTRNYQKATDGNFVKTSIAANDYVALGQAQELIETYCAYPEDGEATYSFNDMYRDEKTCGYQHKYIQRPVFRCALEYTFNSDGSLCITLPANSISFDESTYILKSITPLKYFGSGSLVLTDEHGNKDGYFLYPDGSGTVISFNDFQSAIFSAPVFGIDHAYSDIETLTGDYREQITMPVYGAVFTEATDPTTKAITGADTLNNGFFAIIEEGAALARLHFDIDGNSTRYAVIYPSYQPYPSDTYDLAETLSVSDLSEYTMVSATRYSGSYTTRISMLSDERLITSMGASTKIASYSGMAEVYREYLVATGAISAITEIGTTLPLYIEAFGSMEVTEKILSFPVEVSTALTTFDDIRTMYDELANAKAIILAKAQEYDALAAAEEKDIELKALYEQKAQEYRELSNEIINITNVNFRLTGFTNGGMDYTYPAKVKWDKSVGGKKGFEALLEYSDSVSATAGSHLGIYPEFDFLYITNTAAFDGIYPNGISSKLIDNRYAEKQLYNSVSHMYEASMIKLVSADNLADLYAKFSKDYSKYDVKAISVSTLGSDVNSNFDDDEPVNRDEARRYISETLAAMKADGYDIMVNKGNAYTYKYASHIVDAYVDSSHLRYSSYPVPFFGMALHGYDVSYAGNALNYSGDPNYDILRSIENGASLYYILCYQNTSRMKEDEELNKYYGVDYATWFEKIVDQYAEINSAIGNLQGYKISDHRILTTERVIDSGEREKIYAELVDELLVNIESQIDTAVKAAFDSISANADYGKTVKVVIDKDAIVAEADSLLNLTNTIQIDSAYAETVRTTIRARLDDIESSFNIKYDPSDSENSYAVEYSHIGEFTSACNYITDSVATDGDTYAKTDYTANNYNVVMVTYRNDAGDEVRFVLNYNIYSVVVNFGDGNSFILEKYGYKKI